MLIVATTVLNLPTLLTAEPNLPLLTAAENISDLLRDAPDDTRAQYARILAQNVPKSTSIDVLPVDRSGLFQTGSPLKCVLITQGTLLRNFCQPYSTLSSFMKTVRLAFNDESQQGGQAGYTVLGANLLSNCLQCLTGDKEQHKSGTGGEKIKEALHERLSQKAIGFLGGPLPRLPHELLTAFFAALRADESSAILMSDDHSPFTLFSALTTHPLPASCVPLTVAEAEGLIPRAGVVLHLILPHSLRCPADTYFTQVAMHYPHLHRLEDSTVHFGHYEDPTESQAAARQCHDMPSEHFYSCTGYRLLHWSPSERNPTRLPLPAVRQVLQIAAVISYYTARSIRIDNESSKLLLLTPHNDTVKSLVDALGVPSDQFPPSLYY